MESFKIIIEIYIIFCRFVSNGAMEFFGSLHYLKCLDFLGNKNYSEVEFMNASSNL